MPSLTRFKIALMPSTSSAMRGSWPIARISRSIKMRNALGRLGKISGSLATSSRLIVLAAALLALLTLPVAGRFCLVCLEINTSSSVCRADNSTSADGSALYSTATSRLPTRRLSSITTEKPSVNVKCACGRRFLKAWLNGTVISRDKLGGRPIDTRPVNAPRAVPSSSRASSTWCNMPRPCLSSRLPASVGSAPRPLRVSRFCRNSTSSRRIWRLSAGWATPSASEARVKLPSSATRTK